jgi:tRNA U34 2-thiouridine synthase MnmA/TrmU
VLLDQGLDLTGLHFVLPFFAPGETAGTDTVAGFARDLGLPLRHEYCGMDYMRMVEHPPHGYGSRINPCIDCKIWFIRRAAELMRQEGLDFVATGEVVGQRPMSQQRHTMRHIEKETGLEGRLLRPLSAQLLEPTIPEQQGLVDRSRLLKLSGRSRSPQLELAARMGITRHESPAGGCLFTDGFFASRLRDLFAHVPDYTLDDVVLLRTGRHFRIHPALKMIVSRNAAETALLEERQQAGQGFLVSNFRSRVGLLRGQVADNDLLFLAGFIARYGHPGDVAVPVVTLHLPDGSTRTCAAAAGHGDDVLAAPRAG